MSIKYQYKIYKDISRINEIHKNISRINEIHKNISRKNKMHKNISRKNHDHHIALVARISLTLSRHSSLSFIALGKVFRTASRILT